MHIRDVFAQYRTTFSFDFFPPKDERAAQALFEAIRDLMPLQPAYVSVTYGAGGSTRELTHDLVVRIQKETPLTLVSQDVRKNHRLRQAVQAGHTPPCSPWLRGDFFLRFTENTEI